MGLRFRKSFKVAPGIKLNLNKKSTSVTFGGKGAHYTVSSTGKKTKSVGIPGTGLYYTETSSGKKDTNPPPPSQDGPGLNSSPNNPNGKKKRGCLFYFLALLAICFVIALYSFAWIPAIGFLIYFILKKDLHGTKKRNIAISAAVFITSLIVASSGSPTDSPESIYADWGKDTFDVSDTAEVKITASPSNADISSLELSSNDIAELNYKDGKAIVTFKEPGEAALFFTANDDIESNTVNISVTDKAAEKAKAEEEARIKAEQEAQAKAEEEARIKAEQEAQAKAEEEARIKAEQEAQAKAEEEARIKAEQEAQAAEQARIAQEQADAQAAAQAAAQQPQEASVWLSATGTKYHSIPDCGNMNPNTARQVSLSEAQRLGYEPCKNCH